MKLEFIDVDLLVPTQTIVNLSNLRKILLDFKPEEFEPIPVMQTDSNFLIGGGHHRTALSYFYGQCTGKKMPLPARVVQTQEELRKYFEGEHTKYGFDQFAEVFGSQNTKNRAYFPEHISKIVIQDVSRLPCRSVQFVERAAFTHPESGSKYLFTMPTQRDFEKALFTAFERAA